MCEQCAGALVQGAFFAAVAQGRCDSCAACVSGGRRYAEGMVATCPSSLTGRQAALLLAALFALLWRVIIPAGFMPAQQDDGWVISLCSGQGVQMVVVDRNGQPIEPEENSGGAQPVCAFASLTAPALPAAPLLLLAAAIAYIFARSFAPVSQPVRRPVDRLRPPLRAPPLR